MAIVPESEWRIPTLIVSSAFAATVAAKVSARPAAAASQRLVVGRAATVLYFNMDDPRVLSATPGAVLARSVHRKGRAKSRMQVD
jgi:hypothetical protein